MAQGEGVARLADSVLRATGGDTVLLRIPAPAAAGSAAEELGLATPAFQDVPLAPAAFRKQDSTAKLLVAASAVKALLATLAFDAADALFAAAAGVVAGGVLYEIKQCVASRAAGEVYCYCLTLAPPAR